jgi:hypothetical protein
MKLLGSPRLRGPFHFAPDMARSRGVPGVGGSSIQSPPGERGRSIQEVQGPSRQSSPSQKMVVDPWRRSVDEKIGG